MKKKKEEKTGKGIEINVPEIKLTYRRAGKHFGTIGRSEDLNTFLRTTFDWGTIELREEFIVLYLNTANQILGYYKIGEGGITGVVADVKLIIAGAIKCAATSIVLAHNHPSGNLKASQQDINLTNKVKEAARFMDISVLDHLIITYNSYYSFADEGLLGIDKDEIKESLNGKISNDLLPNEIVLLDLFSGIGGFAKGLSQGGLTIKKHYFSEVDKYCISNYKINFTHAENLGDIKKIEGAKIQRPNIITFGSPCQDVSTIGKMAGLKGKRSSLFFEALKLIGYYRPEVFIFENVKGLLHSNGGKDFARVLQAIADLGLYECQWQLLNTRWFLPQNRERLYLVGTLAGKPRKQIFPLLTNDEDYSQSIEESKNQNEPVLFKVKQKNDYGSACEGDCIDLGFYTSNSRATRIKKGYTGALTRGMIQAVVHKKKIRWFTPIECERLQGFPDDWTKYGIIDGEIVEISDTQRYKMLGNAVSVPVVKAVAQNLRVQNNFSLNGNEMPVSNSFQDMINALLNLKI